MSRGITAGATDYRHQSFLDIQEDLSDWILALDDTIELITKNIQELKENDYWSTVPFDIQAVTRYALKFYRTTEQELSEVLIGIQVEVEKHHINRLIRIAEIADELNGRWGQDWHGNNPKEYGKPEFLTLERTYANGRDMAVDLLDVSNVAERLEDFIGRRNLSPLEQSNIQLHPNIIHLLERMDKALELEDYPGVLHSSASIFETLAKEIVGIDSVQDKTLKSFFARYRKDSVLPSEVLNYIQDIYDLRNTTPLAGHGSMKPPDIGKKDATTLNEITKAFVRIEYILR